LLGPPLGGLLVTGWGWQAVFWAGVPFAALGIVLTLKFVPPSAERPVAAVDAPGALLLAVVLSGLTAAIASVGGPLPGGLPAIAWLEIAVAAAVGLTVVESRAADPLLDGRLLGDRRFRLASLATFLSTGTLMSCFALLPFWLEEARGCSALTAGAAFIPIGVGLAATSRTGGRMGDQGRTRAATMLGMSVAAGGLALTAVAALVSGWPLLLTGLLVVGCGNGLFSSPNTAAAIAVAPRSALGSAAGFLSTARNAGVVTGLAVSGASYTVIVHAHGRRAGDDAAALIFSGAALVCAIVVALAAQTYRTPTPAS